MNIGLLPLLREDPLAFILLAVALIGALSLHEFAHALSADLLGDRMPRAMGRLTLNPLKHLDPLGTLALFLAGFGWAKPVEFRPQALRSKRFGAALVAVAGPLMNLFLAVVGALLFALTASAPQWLQLFLLTFTALNIVLAVFNLIPLPPLDGSRLLTIFLPPRHQRIIFFLDRYGFLILLALVFLVGIDRLDPIIGRVTRFIFDITGVEDEQIIRVLLS